jgi:thiol-disulfide isomerase/thioredoxin
MLPLLLLVAAAADAATLVDAGSARQLAAALPAARLRVVNVWATWCAPCVAEMADLRQIDAKYADRDVVLVGISMDDALPGNRAELRAKVTRFLEQQRIGWKNVYFTGKPGELQDHYRFEGEIPITLVFDANGNELARHQGAIERKAFTALLDRLLSNQKQKENR